MDRKDRRKRAMISVQYKGRIHKSKFTVRSLRYVLSDKAARLFPALQRRWLFPVESQPIWEAASEDHAMPSAIVDAPLPPLFGALGIAQSRPLQLIDHVYSLENVLVTGWAGAMIKDGLLLTIRPQHNWVSALRARPHRLRTLPSGRAWFNLMAPMTAKGHIFHWLFNAMVPLLAYLESGGEGSGLGLIVNAALSEIQLRSIEFLKALYGITAVEPVGERDAVRVPRLKVAIPVPHIPRALQSPLGLHRLHDLGGFIAGEETSGCPVRIYISRNDARLRRVLNEKSLLPKLGAMGFRRVQLAGLPIARQVALFRQAGIVVAPHGAGLAHIAWCKPGTKIVEFFPSPDGPRGRVRNATYDYWLLSQLLGLDYTCRLAGPVETRDDGFSVGEDLLTSTIEEAIAEPHPERMPAAELQGLRGEEPMTEDSAKEPFPSELRLNPEKTALSVTFTDGTAGRLSAEFLRVVSPSAEVQGHSPSERKLVPGKRTVTIRGIEPVGNYAVRLVFSDGHNTGLYSWSYLYEITRNKDALWNTYVEELTAAGLSRDV
jgi:DUF971 family protein